MRGWSGLLGALDFAIRCWRDEDWAWYEGQFVLDKVKDGECGLWFDFSMARVTLGHDEDGEPVTSLTVVPPSPREKTLAPDEAAIAAADDAFVDAWIRREMQAGKKPTGRWLEAQRVHVKGESGLTQPRLRDAIARLKGVGRLEETPGGPSGAKWLRAIDLQSTGIAA